MGGGIVFLNNCITFVLNNVLQIGNRFNVVNLLLPADADYYRKNLN